MDEDRYRVTFVDYGNSCICDNATQIVELPEEDPVEKSLAEAFDAEALVREMSMQFGSGFDGSSVANQIQEAESRSVASVVDEDGQKKMTEVDMLQELDFSLAIEGKKSGAEEGNRAVVPPAKPRGSNRSEAKQEPRGSNRPEVKQQVETKPESKPEAGGSSQKQLESKPESDGGVVFEPSSLSEFLGGVGLLEALPVFEERKLTWNSLKLADADDLAEFGIPKKILQKVIDGLMKIPSTTVFKSGGAQSQEIDYEGMAVLPPLPAEPPLMSNKVAYKNYMRLRYETAKRERKNFKN